MIRVGYLSFQDYAVAKWAHHLRGLLASGSGLATGHPDNAPALIDINNALEDFTCRYEKELSAEKINDKAQDACQIFQQSPFKENLESLWSHVHGHDLKGAGSRDDVSLKQLSEVLTRNRTLLEKLPINPELNLYYSDKRFKCTKINCHYFHEGFYNGKDRDMHMDRHNRP
jgi:hypothetical protein